MLGEAGGRGVRGAMSPSELPWRAVVGRMRGNSTEKLLKRDLNSDARGWEMAGADEASDSVDTGSALSLALKLKKRNKGASQTQNAKKVAISGNPGTPVGWWARSVRRLVCLASSVR